MPAWRGGRRILAEWTAVLVLTTAALATAVAAGGFERADNFVYDRLLRLKPQPATDDILIVTIDDESIARLGRWPWDRAVHARVMDRLAEGRPKAVLYDVLFLEPGSGDNALAGAVQRLGPVLPVAMEVPGRGGEALTLVPPLPALTAAQGSIGHVNLSPDSDGIVRRVHLAEGPASRLVPHVAAITACRSSGRACQLPDRGSGEGLVRRSPYLIPFAGGRQHFRSLPAAALAEGSIDPAFVRDKTVLVGATATGLGDAYATPMAERGVLMPGVEINANIVAGLASGAGIRPAGLPGQLAAALLPVLMLLAGFLAFRPRTNLWLGLGIGTIALGGSMLALLVANLWISPVPALAAMALVFPLWGWRRLVASSSYMRAELQRFAQEDGIAGVRRKGERVQGEIDLLAATIAHTRSLQRFVTDTLQALPDAALVVSPDGRVMMINDCAARLLGRIEERHFTCLLPLLGAGEEQVDRLPSAEALPAEIEDRQGRLFRVRWSPVHDDAGAIAAFVLLVADVSDLRAATRSREEALQLLTHDMRSPQAAILATLSQAGDAVSDPVAGRIATYARRTLALADGFVHLARAEAQQLDRQPVDLGEVLLDAVDELWPLSSEKKMKVLTQTGEAELLVLADRPLVTRALVNLIGNAIKYAPAGSHVHCTVAAEPGFASVSICDEGPGLDPDQVAGLFQPFRRHETKVGGVGLGLAFVQSVALRHGGSVACRSEVGQGCCFEFRLPLEASLSRPPEP